MNIKNLLVRLKGWHKTFRGRFLLLQKGVLNNTQFILLELSFSVLADWDEEHVDTYGSFDYTWEEIGWFFSWDKSTVSRSSKKLFKLHFWDRRPDGRIQVNGFEIEKSLTRITKSEGIVDLQGYIARTQREVSKTQQIGEERQRDLSKDNIHSQAQMVAEQQQASTKEPLVSFNGESSFVLRDERKYEYAKERVKMIEEDLRDKDLNEEARKILTARLEDFKQSVMGYEADNDLIDPFERKG